MVLARCRELAENHVGGKVAPTVLTVPLALTAEQRALVAAAGQSVGLDVLQVLSEPTGQCQPEIKV